MKRSGGRAAPKPTVDSENGSGKKKRGRIENLRPWPKGVSGNPKGGPKRGQSWAESVNRIGNMTPSEAAAYCLLLAKQLLQLGDGITIRDAAIMSSFAKLINDPDGRMFNALSDRAEGKPIQPTEDVTQRPDSELIREFTDLVHAARARAGAGDSGGTPAPGAGGDGGE